MCFDLADGVQLYFAPQKLDKTQPQRFCANEYFTMKTLSATPRPYNRWKAESLSFLHVLLVWGDVVTSLLIKTRQS